MQVLQCLEKVFLLFNTLNFGIGENHFENNVQCSKDLLHLSLAKHILILCRTNNLHNDSPFEIVHGVISEVYVLEKDTTTLKFLFAVYFQEMSIGV